MTSPLTRRLQRLLDRQALATAPERRVGRLHSFDMQAPNDLPFCERPAWSAYFAGEPDAAGFYQAWHILADTAEALDEALTSLTASGDVPPGEWERSVLAACPGGLECDHVPRVDLANGTTVSVADYVAMEGRA